MAHVATNVGARKPPTPAELEARIGHFLCQAHAGGDPNDVKAALDALGNMLQADEFFYLLATDDLRYPPPAKLKDCSADDIRWMHYENKKADAVGRMIRKPGIPAHCKNSDGVLCFDNWKEYQDTKHQKRNERLRAEYVDETSNWVTSPRAKTLTSIIVDEAMAHETKILPFPKPKNPSDRQPTKEQPAPAKKPTNAAKQMLLDLIGASEFDARVSEFDTLYGDGSAQTVLDKLPKIESITAEELRERPVKEVERIVKDWIVANAINGLFGDGGVGKDFILLQLAIAMAFERRWLGMNITPGRVLYFNMEDNEDVLRWRQHKIEEHLKIKSNERNDQLKIVSMIGTDTLLATVEKGIVRPLPLFDSLRVMVNEFEPTVVIVGNRVNIFGVNQNEDAQARQCLGLLNRIVVQFGTTIIMPSHVSVRGNQPGGDGTSGSVQWSNGVRQRLLLRRPTEDETDKDARILEVKKTNWGPSGLELPIRWENGLFVAEYENREKLSNAELVQREKDEKRQAEDEFLRMLDKAEARKLNLSAHPTSRNNAVKLFSEDPDCKPAFKGKQGKKKLAAAMDRLFKTNVIHMAKYGYPSDETYRLESVKK